MTRHNELLSLGPKLAEQTTYGLSFVLKSMALSIAIYGADLPMDGHIAFLHDQLQGDAQLSPSQLQGDARQPVLAVRCRGWQRRLAGDRSVDMTDVMTGADVNAAATVHEGADWEPQLLEVSTMGTDGLV